MCSRAGSCHEKCREKIAEFYNQNETGANVTGSSTSFALKITVRNSEKWAVTRKQHTFNGSFMRKSPARSSDGHLCRSDAVEEETERESSPADLRRGERGGLRGGKE